MSKTRQGSKPSTRKRRCPNCRKPLIKNGKTSAGTQRWRCTQCKKPVPKTTRKDKTFTYRFTLFYTWISRKNALATYAHDLGLSPRTLNRWFEPFWLIQVPHPVTQKVYDQVFLDATFMGRSHKQCLLVARTRTAVIDWQWCWRENRDSYVRLLERIPPPRVATCDGHRGVLAAIEQVWPETQIQRCLVHIGRDIETYTTQNPVHEPNQKLRVLGEMLCKIETEQQAAQWVAALQDFFVRYKGFMSERTYRSDVAPELVPRRAVGNKRWWWTHLRTRQGYRLLEGVYRRGHMFVYIGKVDEDGQPLKSSSNVLEGGTYSGVKELVHVHRGLPPEHVRTMIDWWLLRQSISVCDPFEIAKEQGWGLPALRHLETVKKQMSQGSDSIGPVLYDVGVDTTIWSDELAIRKGQLK